MDAFAFLDFVEGHARDGSGQISVGLHECDFVFPEGRDVRDMGFGERGGTAEPHQGFEIQLR